MFSGPAFGSGMGPMVGGTLNNDLHLFTRGMCRKDCFGHSRNRIILSICTALPGNDALRRVGILVGEVRACLDSFGRVERFRACVCGTHRTGVRVCFAGRGRQDKFPCALGTGVVDGTLALKNND